MPPCVLQALNLEIVFCKKITQIFHWQKQMLIKHKKLNVIVKCHNTHLLQIVSLHFNTVQFLGILLNLFLCEKAWQTKHSDDKSAKLTNVSNHILSEQSPLRFTHIHTVKYKNECWSWRKKNKQRESSSWVWKLPVIFQVCKSTDGVQWFSTVHYLLHQSKWILSKSIHQTKKFWFEVKFNITDINNICVSHSQGKWVVLWFIEYHLNTASLNSCVSFIHGNFLQELPTVLFKGLLTNISTISVLPIAKYGVMTNLKLLYIIINYEGSNSVSCP